MEADRKNDAVRPEAFPWVDTVLYQEADPWTVPVFAGLPPVLEAGPSVVLYKCTVHGCYTGI